MRMRYSPCCAVPTPARTVRPPCRRRPVQVVRVTNWESHRGGLILALGILSWLSCPLFGVFAWILGSGDLSQMRDGRMDPSGMALTQVGYVLGMIHVILCLLVIVIAVFFLLAVAISPH